MSSDVYIDVKNKSNKSWIRIGHLGTLSYFQLNLVEWFIVLADISPIITEHVVAITPKAITVLNKYNDELQQKYSVEEIALRYGYYPGDWDDVINEVKLAEFLQQWVGASWKIRID